MSEERDDRGRDEEAVRAEEAPPQAEVPAEAEQEAHENYAEEVERLREEVQDLKDSLVRQRADFENARRRLRRDAEEAGARAIVRFVRPILDELDNFERAIAAASPESFEDFATGVSMIKVNLDGILAGAGIVPIPCEGVFDPQWHEVVAEVEDPERPRGTIAEVVRSGWKLDDQVIRTAQVVVTRP